jgi:site-specific recombinase XerD
MREGSFRHEQRCCWGPGGRRVLVEVAVSDFERFLAVGKGASVATRECYVRHVRAFLAAVCDASGAIDLGSVSASWVRSYVTELGGRYAPESLKLIATAIRSFLRYAWGSGWTADDLTGAVGPVITHRSGRLPRALAVDDLSRLLASPDRCTTTGMRDYALLTLLSGWVCVPARSRGCAWMTSTGAQRR